jgi:hypothetical protein
MPMNVATRMRAPSIIEIDHGGGNDFSTISSSIGKKNIAIEMEGEKVKEKEQGHNSGGEHLVVEQVIEAANGDAAKSKSESDETNPNEDIGNVDMHSDVDSQAYEDENKEEDQEDDDAFIERLSQMVDFADLLDDEGEQIHVEDRESVSSNLRRSSRTIRPPKRLIEEMSGLSVEKRLTWNDCLIHVYEQLDQEMALVGAGVGGGFGHTSELDVKKYNQAMQSTDLEELTKWVKGIDEEHARFLFDDVWVAVLKGEYENVIPTIMTWALKLKASGVVRARCNVRGFEQIPHIHYDPDSKSSLVTT